MNRLLGQQVSRPVSTSDPYAARAAKAEDIYNASVNPPSTSYVDVRSSLSTSLRVPADKRWTGAPFVSHRWRRNGLRYMWSWGGINMGPFKGRPVSGPNSGQVNSSFFQTTLTQLHNWQTNDRWYIVYPAATVMFGSEHNMGLSFRTPQIYTQTTGGSWPARMTQRPQYKKVQRVPRYNATPRAYNTRSGGN